MNEQMKDKVPFHLVIYQGRFRQNTSSRLCIPHFCTQESLKNVSGMKKKADLTETKLSAGEA